MEGLTLQDAFETEGLSLHLTSSYVIFLVSKYLNIGCNYCRNFAFLLIAAQNDK